MCSFDTTTSIVAAGLAGNGEWWTDCGAEGSEFFVGVLSTVGAEILVIQVVDVDGGIGELVAQLLTTVRYEEPR